MPLTPNTRKALQTLRQRLPEVLTALKSDPTERLNQWAHVLDAKLLPRLQPDFPLVAAICGGGSAGKSTLFNTLVGQTISPTGAQAGLNRRVLAALHDNHLNHNEFFEFLTHAFGSAPQPLKETQQLLTPGEPLYWRSTALPANVVLLDTPDIDTGARGLYANRASARQSLEAADLFIYIFTNATYNNRDITDFIAQMFAGLGRRPCYLVYRVYPSFSDHEVIEHARTVAANIYGHHDGEQVLGIFRADEENVVAAGQKFMTLRPVSADHTGLTAALAALEAERVRQAALGSIYAEALQQARQILAQVYEGKTQLDRYLDLLAAAQGQCVQQALSHFPTDQVLRRFARIWRATDPTHIKLMRQTGRIVEWPYKLVVKAIAWQRDVAAVPATTPVFEADLSAQLEHDLLAAANHLYQTSLAQHIQVGHQSAQTPAVVHPAQEALRRKDWKGALSAILSQKVRILRWSDQLEGELKALAHDLRGRMGVLDQIRQTFAAFLNVIPATAAITYILHTGDPVGATGIKVKLTGIFGLTDLYALIAIPATAGMTSADQRQLEQMLGPVAQAWLQYKLQTVQALFEAQITGELLQCVRSAQTQIQPLLSDIENALAACQEAC